MRLAAGCALLKICRLPSLGAVARLGALGWHRLALLMHDPDTSVRSGFARKIYADSMRAFNVDKRDTKLGAPSGFLVTRVKALPVHFMTVLALAALDPEKDHVKAAKGMLSSLVAKWRAAADKASRPDALPEVQLPWLLHTLAHHPDFEDEEAAMEEDGYDDYDDATGEAADGNDEGGGAAAKAQKGTLPSTQHCLDFYINACLADDANGFDLLRHITTQVKLAHDRLNPNGHETRVVATVARNLVNYRGEHATKEWSSQPIPPKLQLPALLYSRPTAADTNPDKFELLPNFKFIDGIAKSAAGFGVGAAANVGVRDKVGSSTAIVLRGDDGANEKKRKKISGGGGGGGGGGSKGLAKGSPQAGKKAKKKGADESDEDEDEDDEAAREAERVQKEERQRLERERRLLEREARQARTSTGSTAMVVADDDDDAGGGGSGGGTLVIRDEVDDGEPARRPPARKKSPAVAASSKAASRSNPGDDKRASSSTTSAKSALSDDDKPAAEESDDPSPGARRSKRPSAAVTKAASGRSPPAAENTAPQRGKAQQGGKQTQLPFKRAQAAEPEVPEAAAQRMQPRATRRIRAA